MKTWLITGASSGFGAALADAVLAGGDQVAATFRNAAQADAFSAKGDKALGIIMDVTNAPTVDAGVNAAITKFGQIDILVNNAGYAFRAPLEISSDNDALRQLDTNVLGILRVTRAVLPGMRARSQGRIINISSLAGTVGYPTLGLYSASKAAVIVMSEALAAEVGHFGIHITSVEPGGFRTEFGGSSMVTPTQEVPAAYEKLVSAMDTAMAKMVETVSGDPALAALKLIELAEMPTPPIRLALGDDALPTISGALERRLEQYRATAALGQGTSSPV
jgi:NAD(P)-dependent dehydrogenase (short-subunit alcohol dehydrogenase family)